MSSVDDTDIDEDTTYWDHRFGRKSIKLLPGKFEVISGKEMIVTVLGSCVAACIRDKVQLIGGMNHFLLPTDIKEKQSSSFTPAETRYGDLAMQHLIDKVIEMGGERKNLEAKVFGGAKMFNSNMSDIGSQNIRFITEYLKVEGITIKTLDTGGEQARKVFYIPNTGEAFLKRISPLNNKTIELREKEYYLQTKV